MRTIRGDVAQFERLICSGAGLRVQETKRALPEERPGYLSTVPEDEIGVERISRSASAMPQCANFSTCDANRAVWSRAYVLEYGLGKNGPPGGLARPIGLRHAAMRKKFNIESKSSNF